MVVAMILFLICIYLYVVEIYLSRHLLEALLSAVLEDAVIVSACLLTVTALLWCMALLKYQLELISVDRTTVQNLSLVSPKKNICRKITTHEKLMNLAQFFLGRDIGRKDDGKFKV